VGRGQTLDDSANVLASQCYDPYGNPETSSQVGISGYTGELQDAGTNAEYLRARWYQPGAGALVVGARQAAVDQPAIKSATELAASAWSSRAARA
jgi:hypothetical protein